jgi:hypothetical protein
MEDPDAQVEGQVVEDIGELIIEEKDDDDDSDVDVEVEGFDTKRAAEDRHYQTLVARQSTIPTLEFTYKRDRSIDECPLLTRLHRLIANPKTMPDEIHIHGFRWRDLFEQLLCAIVRHINAQFFICLSSEAGQGFEGAMRRLFKDNNITDENVSFVYDWQPDGADAGQYHLIMCRLVRPGWRCCQIITGPESSRWARETRNCPMYVLDIIVALQMPGASMPVLWKRAAGVSLLARLRVNKNKPIARSFEAHAGMEPKLWDMIRAYL